MEKYQLILADPAWRQEKGGSKKVRPNSSGTELDYVTIPLNEIENILKQVSDMSEENHICFLWTIEKYLREAEDIAGRLEYKLHSRMVWNKVTGIPAAFTIRFGHEYLLYLYHGKLLPVAKNERGKIHSVFTEQVKQHSRKPNITACTIETTDYDKHYDVAIIDECFMISDKQRGKNWLKAILNIKADKVHLILNRESEELISNILNITNRKYTKKYYERLVPLSVSDTVFEISKASNRTLFIVFSRMSVLRQKHLFEKRGKKVSVLYGNLPPEIKKTQIEKFINGETDVCVSTDVVGMGVNLPCDNVVFLEINKFDGIQERKINSTEIKQIGGRAGRYGLSKEGKVFTVHKHEIQFFKNSFNSFKKTDGCFLGLNEDTLNQIPVDTIGQKINFFSMLDPIPHNLKNIMKKENVEAYKNNISFAYNINKLDFRLAWRLLNLPIDKGNRYYWLEIINNLSKNIKVSPPNLMEINVADSYSLMIAENKISELDLFYNFYNSTYLSDFIEVDSIKTISDYKEVIIGKITAFLFNKELSNVKFCSNCKINVGLEWVHKLCDDCFHENRNYRSYDYND